VQIISGEMALNGQKLKAGDGAAIKNEPELSLSGIGEALVFDLG
jgi:hypothetical protein